MSYAAAIEAGRRLLAAEPCWLDETGVHMYLRGVPCEYCEAFAALGKALEEIDRIAAIPPLSITVALPERALCGNGRAHGIGRARMIAEQREAARTIAAAAHRSAIGVFSNAEIRAPLFPSGRVAVKVHVSRDPLWSPRKLDDDNLQRGLKAVQDALQDALIVADDRQCYYDGPATWERGRPMAGWVRLTLRPAPGE